MASEAASSPTTRTICFDLDGTLCTNTFGEYERAEPFAWAIERVNELARAGHRIIVFTARGTATGLDWDDLTRGQLARWGLEYDELRFGKPSADVYVDDRAVHTEAWRFSDVATVPGFGGGSGASAEHELPALGTPHLTTVVEVGRTFRGEPVDLRAHAARAVERAKACGIACHPHGEEVEEAVLAALKAVPRDGGDLVFAVSLSDGGHAGFADALEAGQAPTLGVGCRRLSQAAAGLRRFGAVAGREGVAVAATTGPEAGKSGAWPLRTAPDGVVFDPMGGHIAAVGAEGLALGAPETGAGPATERFAQVADEIGLTPQRRPIARAELSGAREAFIVGFPFCLVALATVDGERLDAPGPAATELLTAWSRQVGIDIGAQTASLLEGPASAAERSPRVTR